MSSKVAGESWAWAFVFHFPKIMCCSAGTKKRYFNKGLCLDMTSGEGFYIYSIFRVFSHEQVYQFGIADVQDCTHSNE